MVSGTSGVHSGGFSSGGTVSGGSTGFTTGTTVSGSASGYTIGSDGVARNAAGAIVGRVDASGNVVNSAGQIIARGVSGSSVGGTIGGALGGSAGSVIGGAAGAVSGGGVSAGGFTVRADGSVANSAGVVIGRVDANGNVIDAAGRVIGSARPRG